MEVKPQQLTIFPVDYLEQTARAEMLRRFADKDGVIIYEYRKKGNTHKHDLRVINKLIEDGIVSRFSKTNVVAVYKLVNMPSEKSFSTMVEKIAQ